MKFLEDGKFSNLDFHPLGTLSLPKELIVLWPISIVFSLFIAKHILCASSKSSLLCCCHTLSSVDYTVNVMMRHLLCLKNEPFFAARLIRNFSEGFFSFCLFFQTLAKRAAALNRKLELIKILFFSISFKKRKNARSENVETECPLIRLRNVFALTKATESQGQSEESTIEQLFISPPWRNN